MRLFGLFALVIVGLLVLAQGAGGAHPLREPVRTLVSTDAPISAFAQDRGWFAWSTPTHGCVGAVAMRTVKPGPIRSLTTPGGDTCDGGEIDYWFPTLAIAGTRTVWETGLAALTYMDVELHVGSPRSDDRDLVIVEHQTDPNTTGFAGLETPIAGRGSLLAYADDEVWRIVGRRLIRVAGFSRVTALTTDGSRLAALQRITARKSRLVVQRGASIMMTPPTALALSGDTLAVLTRGRINIYDANSGKMLRTLRVPGLTAPSISLSGTSLVFAAREGRDSSAIELLDTRTGSLSALARATATPIGLSIVDNRVAWAENVGGHGQIEALDLRP